MNHKRLQITVTPFDRLLVTTAVLGALVTGPAGTAASAPQGATETMKDGVLHVDNAAEPLQDPTFQTLDALWEVGGDEEDEFYFGVLTQITSDSEGNVYVLDAQLHEVMVFSPDGEYLRSLGREGEGPGEFRRPADLFLTADGKVAVMQRMPGKIVLLTPDGGPAGNLPVPEGRDGGMQMFQSGRLAGDHVVLQAMQWSRNEEGMSIEASLISIDGQGNKTATYATRTTTRSFANMVFDEKKGLMAFIWSAGGDGRVYTSDEFDAYRLKMWKPDGTLDRVVTRAYEARKRTEEEKERNRPRVMMRRGGRTQQPEVKVSDTDRDIQRIFPRDDGSVWVLSSHGAFSVSEGTIATFDVFDTGGQFVSQATLKGEGDFSDDGFHIVKDRLYVVKGLRSARRAMFGLGGEEGEEEEEEEEPEPMSVICYDLTPIVSAKPAGK